MLNSISLIIISSVHLLVLNMQSEPEILHNINNTFFFFSDLLISVLEKTVLPLAKS